MSSNHPYHSLPLSALEIKISLLELLLEKIDVFFCLVSSLIPFSEFEVALEADSKSTSLAGMNLAPSKGSLSLAQRSAL